MDLVIRGAFSAALGDPTRPEGTFTRVAFLDVGGASWTCDDLAEPSFRLIAELGAERASETWGSRRACFPMRVRPVGGRLRRPIPVTARRPHFVSRVMPEFGSRQPGMSTCTMPGHGRPRPASPSRPRSSAGARRSAGPRRRFPTIWPNTRGLVIDALLSW